MRKTIEIPEGYEARIESNKVILVPKESEDERIRREIIDYLSTVDDKVLIPYESWIAWLEKKGEKNPSDSVVPKFKVGVWIIHNKNIELANSLMLVTGKNNDGYLCRYMDGQCSYNIKFIDKEYRLWSIQDAKDGDVLCTYECDKPKVVFILKGTPKKHYALSYYCFYNIMYPHFDSDSEPGCLAPNDEDVKPATKEQRDLLFQKMSEAGYEWDAEKKELKKIEQNLAWSEDDESWFKELELMALSFSDDESYRKKFFDWLKSLKSRYTWKPSDEQMEYLAKAITTLGNEGDNKTSAILCELRTDLKKLKG